MKSFLTSIFHIPCLYDRLMQPVERASLAGRRRELLIGLKGRTLEVGGGTGANLPYCACQEQFIISEPDSKMLKVLTTKQCPGVENRTVLRCTAECLPFRSGTFDGVVSTLTLCSVQEHSTALAEIWRVLRPGGRLFFIEHVLAPGRRGRWQHRVNPLWSALSSGCHPNRATIEAIQHRGFIIEDLEKFDPSITLPLLTRLVFQVVLPFVQGTALKPGETERRPKNTFAV